MLDLGLFYTSQFRCNQSEIVFSPQYILIFLYRKMRNVKIFNWKVKGIAQGYNMSQQTVNKAQISNLFASAKLQIDLGKKKEKKEKKNDCMHTTVPAFQS